MFGAGFGLCRSSFGSVFAGWFVRSRPPFGRDFVGGSLPGFPGLRFEVVEHGLFVAMKPNVAIGAQQHEVVDVRWAFSWRLPRQQMMGHALGMVGAAFDAAAVSADQPVDLSGSGEPGLAALPQQFASGGEDLADPVGVLHEFFDKALR